MGLVHPDIKQKIQAIMIAHDPDKNNKLSKLSYDDLLQAIHGDPRGPDSSCYGLGRAARTALWLSYGKHASV
jgi:hypothetical protein